MPALLNDDQKEALLEAAFAPDCCGVLSAALMLELPLRRLHHTLMQDAAFALEVQGAERMRQQAARERLVRDAEDERVPEKTRQAIRRDLAKKGSPLQLMKRDTKNDSRRFGITAEPNAAPEHLPVEPLVESVRENATDGTPVQWTRRPDWEAIQREIGMA